MAKTDELMKKLFKHKEIIHLKEIYQFLIVRQTSYILHLLV